MTDRYEIDVAGLKGSCKVTVLEAERKPVINWKPQKIECEAGKEKKIKVPFQVKGTRRGDPKPILLKNGKPVDLDKMKDLIEVVINGDVAEIIFKNPQKGDTGKWALKLENTAGESALAPFDLFVRDKPKVPKGPLETTDVTAESCKLKWKPADPDEAAPTRGYIVEMQDGRGGPWKKIGETKGTEFPVNGLKEHGEYKFRIKAFNEIGESDPLVGETILAKNPYTVPGKPKNMQAADIDANSLTLQWDPPDSDGGAPIESYIIERRDKSDKDWAKLDEIPAQGAGKHQMVDDKVVEGKEYYYRVRAVNKAGPGDPCDHGKPFKIAAKPASPEFTSGGIQDQRLHVGETIKYEVGISGAPLPEVSWTVNGKPLKAGGRVKISTEKGKTVLKIEDAQRSDSGKFCIKLKNKSGEAQSEANVTVVGRPDPPQGPLEVSDICKDGATLEWKPPLDDGGEPLTGYIDVDGGSKFVPVGKCGPGETKLKVKGLKDKGNYKFRVKAVNKEGESEPLGTDKHYQIKDPWEEPGKPGRPQVTDVDADKVSLKWDPPMKDGGAPIEKYVVEMRDPKSKDWVEVATSEKPEATVKGLETGKEYQFRVKAVNKAGPGQPSEPCEKVLVQPKFVPAWLDHDGMKNLVVRAGQTAKWTVKFNGKPAPDVFWSKNGQPITDQSGAIQIDVKKNDHTILCIPAAVRADRGRYALKVKNKTGEDSAEADLTVLDKPGKPRGPLDVSNVTEEGCSLEWKPPEDDGGEPIEYYEVEKLDADTGRWTPCAKVKDCKADVKGLQKGKQYQFRVKAVNKEGQSEPLVGDQSIIAKNPYDIPGKCGAPDIVDWDEKSAQLAWDPPTHDGGAPIEDYIVEKKSKHDRDWKECARVGGPTPSATIKGLKEGEEYEFRVRAVNKAGPGQPSDPSRRLLVKPRHQAPRIDRSAMKAITIKVGQSLDFNVPVTGEPPPEKTWTINGKPIDDDSKIRVTNEEYKTNLALRNATRDHAGTYLLVATNENGTDQYGVEVTVLGRPSAPEGPLEVKDVFEDRATLSWKAPLDDGGMPIDHYEVEKMDLATGRWVPCGRCTEPGMTVENLQPGHQYQFRVRAVNKEGESDPLVTTDPTLAKNPFDTPGKMEKPEVTDWDADHVDLAWKPPTNDGGAPVEEYLIEKKDGTTGKWTEALKVPSDQLAATVPGLRPGEEYQFRITARNKGGLGEPSDPTDTVIAKARNLAPKIHREDLSDTVLRSGQDVKFNVHIDGEPPPTVTWTFEGKPLFECANVQDQDYLSKFALVKPTRAQSGKYTITATNPNGTDSVTVQIDIKGRPSKPKGPLEVSDVFENKMTLDWKPPEDDGGEPISHYEVERQDSRDGIWVPCGTTAEPHMIVDGLSKGSNYKFRVKAVNAEGKSDPLETEKATQAKNPYEHPDKPNAPELVDWDADHVDLKWEPPANDGGAPIEQYIVEKRSKYGRWEPALTTDGQTNAGTVDGLTKGEEYEFRVTAVNKGGPSEPSDPTRPVVAKPRNVPPKIGELKPLRLHAGQMINFDVPVEGEPLPKVSWFGPDGSELHGGPKMRVEHDEESGRAKLQIKGTDRSHSGEYKIRAVNDNGEAEERVRVDVIDKPSAPEGPLNVTDIHADNCTLDWKPPLDDGGSPIECYQIEKMDPSTGRWVKAGKTTGPDCSFKVDGLTPGHDYKFRVSAINAEGESEPLETDHKITAKEPFDAPGKPGKPELVDWDKEHVDLKWEPPTEDGGAPIEEYVVEMRDKFSPQWKPVKTVPASAAPQASVDGLQEGEEYEFRVVAKNKAGKGQPSDPSDAVIAKDRNVPPKIDRNSIHEIRVRAGQPFQLDIPISGEPPPEITWDFQGKPLVSDDRMKIVCNEKGTKFTVKRSLRSDTGIFNITAVNDSGTDKAEVHVTVPGEPRGPLNISNVNKNGCTLDWKPPTDDGGAGISHYVVEKLDLATGRWVPAAECTDCKCELDNLTPGHEYRFRVKAVNKYGESDPLEAQKSVVAKDPFDTADRPGTPDIVDWDKNWADLKWTPPTDDGGAPLEKYVVEKRMGTGDWEYATEVPATQTDARVEGLQEGKQYQFRVKAVNKAGASAPSDPSRLLIAKARRLPPKIDRSAMPELRIRRGETVEFNVPVEGEPNPKCQWSINGTPLATSDRTKVDNTNDNNTKLKTLDAERMDSGVYKLIATNEHGQDEAEVLVTVLDVPSPPGGPLEAREVTKDSATLKWFSPEDDGGSPVTHYIVEKQEPNGRWIPCGESPDTSLRVNRLVEGKEYKFRVKAVNRQGESKPLTGDQSIIAKNPWEKPGKPQDVKVVDWDKDHMDLEWKPPITDGGAPIEGYVIEKKPKNGLWTPCGQVPGNQCKGTADGLIPGEEYQFRIKAINKAGEGEPSDPTDPKIAKPRKLAPKLNLNTLMDIRVRAGQPVNISAEFEGEPKPTATWTINGKPFTGTSHADLDNDKEHLSCITIGAAERSDAGTYSITVQNEYGTDQGQCKVTVLDVPGPPQGPLAAKNIHKEGCTLSWRPPEDDGGAEIIGYVVEKMDTTRGTWQEVGQFPDCEAKVGKLIPGKQYLFRVKALNVYGESKPLEGDKAITAKNPFDVPDPPDAPEITDYDETRIDIGWRPPANDGGAPITGYIVEKRERGSPLWIEVGRCPSTSFSCTGLRKGQEYEFRVSAVNEAGPSAPSDPSASQICKARWLKPAIITQQRKWKVRAGNTLTLDIEFVGAPDPSVGWTKVDGGGTLPPELIVDVRRPGQTSIFFPSAKRSESGAYELRLKNEVGEAEGTFEVLIQDKPSPPKGPIVVDGVTKDSCQLSWKPPEDDGGSPLTNYVVEKREIGSNVWTPVSNFVPGCQCSVPKLKEGQEYEFRVCAENALGRSDPLVTDSPVLAKDPFGRPGKPGRPEITDHDNNYIALKWKPPNDTGGSPITHYDVQRKDQKTGRWIKVNTHPVYGTEYTDERVQPGHGYEYRVVAVNKAGPGDPSDPSELAWAKPKFEAPRFELDIDGKEIRVRAGQPLDLAIPYIGSPQPTITWTKEGQQMSGIETKPGITRLYIPQSKRSDSGQCRIEATNEKGKAEARVLINVIDRPGPPEGPLTYPSTSRRGVTLAWKPPKDDGGAEISGYRIEYQEIGAREWERVPEQITLLNYTVRNLEKGKEYKFRVFAENMVGQSDPLNGDPVTAKDPFDPPGPPSTPEITAYDTNMVALRWNPPRDDGGSPITGYIVERFEKRGGGDWAPVKSLGICRLTSANVTGLAQGETYQFRVRAVNAAGEGPPSGSCEPVECRPFVEPPGAPDKPRIGKVTKHTVDLNWNRPLSDGGAPIEGYIVEQRKMAEGEEWCRSNTGLGPGKMCRDTRCTVEGLPEKEQFEFRVIAVNRAGEGEPSKPSDMVLTTDQPGRPILDLSGLKDITVRAGETITFTLPYSSGGAKPTVDVLNGGQTIFEDDRTTLQVEDDKIIFTTLASKRSDAGPYKVVVQNRYGKDSAKLNVNVLDVPGKPTGPILFSELSGDACTLHWSPPKDDGGSPVSNYVIERKPAKGGDWERVGAPAGLSFRCRGLNHGERYDFRVRAENEYGVGEPLDADESLLAKGAFDVPGPPGAPEPIHTADDSITLEWTRPLYDGGAPITGYVLDKREAGKNAPWERAAFGNVPETRFKVTGVKPQHTYEFRVAAVNAVGQGGWSENSVPIIAAPRPSKPIISMGMLARDMIALVGDPVKILVPYAASPKPEITWTKNGLPFDAQVRTRSEIESSDFLTQLNYPKCERGDTGTYSIKIENDLGSDSVDLKLKVVDRPSPPEGPLECDDIGPESCRLAWKPPKDDGGSPITNYVIEKCRLIGGQENWERLSSFVRGTNTLVPGLVENERYRFRVLAENQYGLSDPLELPEPIVAKYQFSVPGQPDKPTVRDFDRNWALVEWDPPASNGGSKILGYNLQYRDQHSHKWITANKALIEQCNFKVSNLRDQGEYEFRVVAKNAAGWSRPSPPSDKIQLRQRYGPPGPPIQLRAQTIGPNWVTLTWQPPADDGGCKLVGYVIEKREFGHQQWEMATPETTPLTEFTVPGLKEFHDYEFRAIALNSHGRGLPSLPTSPIKIQETAGCKPTIVVKPEDVACPYNKRAVLTCEAVGRPKPTARWLRNGREIPDGARYRVEDNGEGLYKLIIKEVWDIDGGDYTCEVSNVFGVDTATASLKVQAPPVIEKQVPNAVYPAGDMVRIKIFFSGSPPFTHRFTLNGIELNPDAANIRWVDFDDHVLLTIPELRAHEAGRYEYQVKNESGEASTGFWLNVSGLPSVPEGPLQITDIGEHQCTVSWRPPAHDGGSRITNYILEKRDLRSAESDTWVTVASAVRELSFIVAGLFSGHEYDFRVSACNANGQGPALNSDKPVIARLPFDPPGPPLLPGVVDVGPEYAVLSWQRPERDGGGRIRGYMVEKCEQGTELWQKCTQAPSPSTSLNATNLIDGRSYNFRVVAVNDAGESTPALVENYEFSPDSKGRAPEIIGPLRDQHGTAGGTVSFECEIGGSPKPDIHWFRGSRELVDTPKCTLIDKGTKQVCIVNNLHPEDEDEYTCRATNQFGTRSTRAQLKLSTKPRLLVPPKYFMGLEVEAGHSIELRIPYKAYPPVTSTWTALSFEEERQLSSGGRYALQTDEKIIQLRISDCTRADAGEYRIFANNSVGSDSAVIKLVVLDKPEPPRFPIVENVLDGAAILSWKPPALDGGALVTNYIVEKRESGGQWKQCARSRFCYLTIEGLKAKESYEFRIIAENKHGLSEPSESTQSCTIPESRVKRINYEGAAISNGVGVSIARASSHASSSSFSMLNSHSSSLLTTGVNALNTSKTFSSLAVSSSGAYSRSSRSPSPRLSTFSSTRQSR
ncbi:unnamed protein product [Meloidogyne enterolobii]|uniref:Uncharacterized protein n=1 Tax=Meloidogyne enterolobii TaxID=390850 RepID=A0ACB0Z7G9_MELEN